MTIARMASSSAERTSLSDTPIEKSARRSFHASKAVAITITAAGVSVWPCPHSTPAKAVTIIAAEVVSSVPCPARSVDRFSTHDSRPANTSALRP